MKGHANLTQLLWAVFLDERWGMFINRCELNEGHPGDHRTAYTACDPVAYLSWSGTAHDGSSESGGTLTSEHGDSCRYHGRWERINGHAVYEPCQKCGQPIDAPIHNGGSSQ